MIQEPKAGLEVGEEGHAQGKNPAVLTEKILADCGHEWLSPLKVMRAKCIDCCGGELGEVRKCTAVSCPLWPYRMGTNPFRRKT